MNHFSDNGCKFWQQVLMIHFCVSCTYLIIFFFFLGMQVQYPEGMKKFLIILFVHIIVDRMNPFIFHFRLQCLKSYLICCANLTTVFCMKCNTGIKWVKAPHRGFYSIFKRIIPEHQNISKICLKVLRARVTFRRSCSRVSIENFKLVLRSVLLFALLTLNK